MKIIPLDNKVQLDIQEATAGALSTASRDSAVEFATVIKVGDAVSANIKVGDSVFVKAWAIDIIDYNGKKYYFCDLTTNGILAIVK